MLAYLFKEEKEDPLGYFAKSGANKEEILAAENELKITFSNSYKYYLEHYGGGAPTSFLVHGIKKRKPNAPNEFYTVTGVTQRYRDQDWPGTHEWYVVCSDHDGNPYGVDKDGKVWLSDHDTQEIILVADDFEEFLYLLYTDTMWDEGYRKIIPWDEYLRGRGNKK